jgi:predicted nucleotidyltransferase
MSAVEIPAGLHRACDEHPWPLLFATVSGAHLYGFPSPDSDWDLRGAHVLPAAHFLRIDPPEDETITVDRCGEDLHLDLVTHEVRKFLSLLRRPNGYVLEQVLSPWIVRTSSQHEELCTLARRAVTREHARHYLGFAQGQWRLWTREPGRRVKPLLYVYRVLLTGLRLLRGGGLECDLRALLDDRPEFADLRELIAAKRAGGEDLGLAEVAVDRHRIRFEGLCAALVELRERSALPERHGLDAAFEDFLAGIRAGTWTAGAARGRRSDPAGS